MLVPLRRGTIGSFRGGGAGCSALNQLKHGHVISKDERLNSYKPCKACATFTRIVRWSKSPTLSMPLDFWILHSHPIRIEVTAADQQSIGRGHSTQKPMNKQSIMNTYRCCVRHLIDVFAQSALPRGPSFWLRRGELWASRVIGDFIINHYHYH